MGQVNDLKKQVYGNFIAWLEEVKIGDCFSNDVWAAKIFDKLFQSYQEMGKANNIKNQFVNEVSEEELENILGKKKAFRIAAEKEKQEKESKNGTLVMREGGKKE